LARLRGKEDDLVEFARGQARDPTALVNPTKRKAPFVVEAVPPTDRRK
jgi:hypothetical protein